MLPNTTNAMVRPWPRSNRTGAKEANGGQLSRLAPARHEWPRRSAAEQHDERASLHSITSSARKRSLPDQHQAGLVGGLAKPGPELADVPQHARKLRWRRDHGIMTGSYFLPVPV